MNRQEAIELVRKHVSDEALIYHMIATGAIMEGLAERFGEDKEKWTITGILHDIDYQETKDDPQRHSIVGGDMLKNYGFDDEIVHAVIVHNDIHGIERKTLLDKALYAVDPLSGLITATAYVMPTKKLEEVQLKSVKKKFKDKTFAKGANREQIKTCEEFGIPLDDFLELAIVQMKKIAPEIGL